MNSASEQRYLMDLWNYIPMAEAFFQFKKFRVYHHRCGFKVGTDGVLLGSWVPVEDDFRVLDIGTGTGLISLMMAQRAHARIDAIEIHPCTAMQARSNVERSPFSDIRVHNIGLEEWIRSGNEYDLIVCNPPFYSHAQPPRDESLRLAKHTDALNPDELFRSVRKLLTPDGHFAIIFPCTEYDAFCSAAKQHGFHPVEVIDIHSQPDAEAIRLMVNFATTDKHMKERRPFYIHQTSERHNFSEEYRELTKDYFLRF